MTKALIIVDVQNDFIDGSLAVKGGAEAASRIVRLIAPMSDSPKFDYIVTTQDWHFAPGDHWSDTPDFKDSWPKHAKAFSWGARLEKRLVDYPFDARFLKGRDGAAYSGFEGVLDGGDQSLADWLREHQVTEVDVVGIATDYCVKATAMDAMKEGFNTTLLSSYVAAVSPETGEQAINEMKDAGVVVK